MAGSLGVRKGAWTEEEDNLLRKCIEKYGESKWHQVPLRAGLSRGRKSCRVRWMNYLKPNIKRGMFEADEVDLIMRLHKLLGNRWSLIAGRLPGRTANHVKNYWNTHLRKISTASCDEYINRKDRNADAATIIKPRPRAFSETLPCSPAKTSTQNNMAQSQDNFCKPSATMMDPPQDNETLWWESLLAGKEFDEGMGWPEPDEEAMANFWDKKSATETTKVENSSYNSGVGHSASADLSFDVDLRSLLDS